MKPGGLGLAAPLPTAVGSRQRRSPAPQLSGGRGGGHEKIGALSFRQRAAALIAEAHRVAPGDDVLRPGLQGVPLDAVRRRRGRVPPFAGSGAGKETRRTIDRLGGEAGCRR